LSAELAKTFLTRPRADWLQRLQAEDVPHAPVLTAGEVFDDPQVRHLGSLRRLEHPREGEMWVVNPPVWLDGERPGAMQPPPVLGEHSDEVLAELGLGAAEIAQLRKDKVV
jgi:crotonobetainyl-CoA:carnitine CoA-transferase CaiB-like acyl-CoA transferase